MRIGIVAAVALQMLLPVARRRAGLGAGRCRPRARLSSTRWDPHAQAEYFYNDVYEVQLPEGHRFPMEKYRLVRRQLQHILGPGKLASFTVSPLATMEELRTTHCEDYVARYLSNQFTALENRRAGFPWSPENVNRSLSSVGGTLAAARRVLADGGPRFAGHIAGGTHHAFRDHAEGFSIFNDIAVAANVALQENPWLERVLVVDLDVHQGNGNAVLFRDEDRVFTFSMQCRQNIFSEEQQSDLDVWVEKGAGDEAYIAALEQHLPPVFDRVQPQLVFFQAGVDVGQADRLGHLRLTREGLRRRNQHVYDAVLRHGSSPRLVISLGGGYPTDLNPQSQPFRDIVDLHSDVYVMAAQLLARDAIGAYRAADDAPDR